MEYFKLNIDHIRLILATSLIALIVFCQGCSVWQVEKYYSPKADSGKCIRGSRSGIPIKWTYDGPPDRIEYNKDDFKLTVSIQNDSHYLISFGPGPFPIIPVFYLNVIPFMKSKPKNNLVVQLYFHDVKRNISIDSHEIKVFSTTVEDPYIPISIQDLYGQSSLDSCVIIPIPNSLLSNQLIWLTYSWPVSIDEQVSISIDGIFVDGEKINFPKLFFSPATDAVLTGYGG